MINTADAGFGVQGGQFGFNIAGATNLPVVVQASPGFVQPDWTPVQSLTLTNGLAHFSEPLPTNQAGRFYRLHLP